MRDVFLRFCTVGLSQVGLTSVLGRNSNGHFNATPNPHSSLFPSIPLTPTNPPSFPTSSLNFLSYYLSFYRFSSACHSLCSDATWLFVIDRLYFWALPFFVPNVLRSFVISLIWRKLCVSTLFATPDYLFSSAQSNNLTQSFSWSAL